MGAARNGECSAVVVVAGIRWALRSIVHAVVAAAAICLEFCKLGLEALQALGVGRVVATKRGLWTALEVSRVVTTKERRWTLVRRTQTVTSARAGPFVALTEREWGRSTLSQEGRAPIF